MKSQRERGAGIDTQRVAIGLGSDDFAHRDRTARARPIDDDHLLIEHRAHFVGKRPGKDVGGAARREPNQQPNRAIGKVRLRGGERRGEGERPC